MERGACRRPQYGHSGHSAPRYGHRTSGEQRVNRYSVQTQRRAVRVTLQQSPLHPITSILFVPVSIHWLCRRKRVLAVR
jgi:hypothetical protein